jgi:hypothetical protein
MYSINNPNQIFGGKHCVREAYLGRMHECYENVTLERCYAIRLYYFLKYVFKLRLNAVGFKE